METEIAGALSGCQGSRILGTHASGVLEGWRPQRSARQRRAYPGQARYNPYRRLRL